MTGNAMIDDTHDPSLTSWEESANGHPVFPVQNLPVGLFSVGSGQPRGGMAIGDKIVDIAVLSAAGSFTGDADAAARAASGPTLEPFFALPPRYRQALRRAVSSLLSASSTQSARTRQALVEMGDATMHLPCRIANFSDFFAGIHHARAAGRILRGSSEVAANYKYVPIAYHGRASSVRVSGTPVHWPNGQVAGPGDVGAFGPSKRVDYETEVALWVGGSNELGHPTPIAEAGDRLVGIGMLNDWSARDVQRWEAQPLGPFLAKSFMTTVSPWIVLADALAPFRKPLERGDGEPVPLPHLHDANDAAFGAISMRVSASIRTERMRTMGLPPHQLNTASTDDLYWTPAQMIAHHTSNGCDLRAGDLLGTGTISAPPPGTGGALLELTEGGASPIALPSGELRGFLEPGDEVILDGICAREGFVSIGTGPAAGTLGVPQGSEMAAS